MGRASRKSIGGVLREDPVRRLVRGETVSKEELSSIVWHHGSAQKLEPENIVYGVSAGAWFQGFHMSSHVEVAEHYATVKKFIKEDKISGATGWRYEIEVDVQNTLFACTPVHPLIRDLLEEKIRAAENPREIFDSNFFSDSFLEHVDRVREGESLRFSEDILNITLIKWRAVSEEEIAQLGWDSVSFFVNKMGPNPDAEASGQALDFASELILLDPQNQIRSFREIAMDSVEI